MSEDKYEEDIYEIEDSTESFSDEIFLVRDTKTDQVLKILGVSRTINPKDISYSDSLNGRITISVGTDKTMKISDELAAELGIPAIIANMTKSENNTNIPDKPISDATEVDSKSDYLDGVYSRKQIADAFKVPEEYLWNKPKDIQYQSEKRTSLEMKSSEMFPTKGISPVVKNYHKKRFTSAIILDLRKAVLKEAAKKEITPEDLLDSLCANVLVEDPIRLRAVLLKALLGKNVGNILGVSADIFGNEISIDVLCEILIYLELDPLNFLCAIGDNWRQL